MDVTDDRFPPLTTQTPRHSGPNARKYTGQTIMTGMTTPPLFTELS